MSHIFVSSDLIHDDFIEKEIPKILGAAGHAYAAMNPLDKIVEACEHAAFGDGGTDLALLIHSSPTARGIDSPARVLKKLRGLSDHFVFRSTVKAKSLPVLVIAKDTELPGGDLVALNSMDWVKIIDPAAGGAHLITAIKKIVFDWRTDLLRELECVGYAVVIGPTGHLDVKPTFKVTKEKDVEGEILKGPVPLTALQKAKYLVLSSDVFKAGEAYRQLAYLVDHFRGIARQLKTKPEEVFQRFFNNNREVLFPNSFAQLFPKPRLVIPEDKNKWLEPDFVVEPRVSARLGTRWEILDLKLPDVPVVRGSKFHQTFTSDIFKAFQQLDDYHNFFSRDDKEAKDELFKHFAHHPKNPKRAVLIGRSATQYQEAFDKASRTFPSVEVITYDEILNQQSLQIADEWDWITKIT
jgi:hypothetical protein